MIKRRAVDSCVNGFNHYMWYTLTMLLYVVLLLFVTKCYTFTNYKCHAKLHIGYLVLLRIL